MPRKTRDKYEYEGSSTDERRDRAEARKRKISLKQWEKSDEDRRQDAKYQRELNKRKK